MLKNSNTFIQRRLQNQNKTLNNHRAAILFGFFIFTVLLYATREPKDNHKYFAIGGVGLLILSYLSYKYAKLQMAREDEQRHLELPFFIPSDRETQLTKFTAPKSESPMEERHITHFKIKG